MWFAFALLSAVLGGFQSFLNKVAAEKKADTYYISAVASIVTLVASLLLFVLSSSSLADIPALIYWLAIISGFLYIGRTITQLEALRFIDAAIFFPLYKVIGPAFVTIIGIAFLNDKIDLVTFFGIVLSCIVPLLLITRAEHLRQKNLKLGLVLMFISTLLAALVAADNAWAVKIDESFLIPFVLIAYAFSAIFAILMYLWRYRAHHLFSTIKAHSTKPAMAIGCGIGFFSFSSFYFLMRAFAQSDLSVVYSINAHYVVIPVILSVWFYKEHWNKQKAVALIISVLALILLH